MGQDVSLLAEAYEEYSFADGETESIEAKLKYVNDNGTRQQETQGKVSRPKRKLVVDERIGELHEIFVELWDRTTSWDCHKESLLTRVFRRWEVSHSSPQVPQYS